MTDTVDDVDLPYDEDAASQQEKIQALQERLDVLESQNEEMRDKLLDANAENNKYQQKLERLTHENKKLKQSPLFVATVQEITDEGVIIKQHGNNQEALTEVTDELRDDLEPDSRVAVNNSLSIVKRLDNETDVRARVMQVEHSPEVSYADIGGLEQQMQEVRETVEMPLESPEMFEQVGIQPPSGVLLYGPPGTGKTLLAKAVANESESNFISVKGPELLNKFVGESEKGVREIFKKARENAPTVVFFDEIDSIATERGRNTGDSGVSERVVSQLLTELDGLESLEDVVVVATTNRPDLIDSALLRPGRLDRHVHVPVPDEDARRAIFAVHTEHKPLADDVDLDQLARKTEGYVGADIEAVCREASMAASREFIRSVSPEEVDESIGNVRVTMDHFEAALEEVNPSVTQETRRRYEEIEERFQKSDVEREPEAEVGRTFQ
ncbi:AAA family ATPase [Halogeometricum sp. CBA1124]|uniref:AAA family ATPase n=1 Tax=Halogeometricum sp. CBA1124 TaxID=2668071 RepID=UPI001429CF93|nr:AAA family ATPase [Halogeometricum sp. CBA1124]